MASIKRQSISTKLYNRLGGRGGGFLQMSSGYFILPNLSRLPVGPVDTISGLGDTSKKRKDVEPANYKFPEDGIMIRNVDWHLVRETIKKESRHMPADAFGYPSYRLTFQKRGEDDAHIAVNLHMLPNTIKMLNSSKSSYCFRVGLPKTKFGSDNLMYMGDFFHAASMQKLSCDMSPDYRESSEGVDLLWNSVTTIASYLGCIIKLQDASKFNTTTIPVILPVLNQVMTKTLRLKRGYGYYDARGFMPSLIDHAILKEMGMSKTDMPKEPDKFIKAFQINMDWIHLWVTTPLNALEPALVAFANKVADDRSSPTIMVQLFATAKQRFEDGLKMSIPYLIGELDELDETLKRKSMRELVYEMDVPNAIYTERLYKRRPKKSPDRYDIFMSDAASFMERPIDLEVDIGRDKIELQSSTVTQRTFKMENKTGAPSVFRMGVSVPPGGDGRPIVQLVELNSDITVYGISQVAMST